MFLKAFLNSRIKAFDTVNFKTKHLTGLKELRCVDHWLSINKMTINTKKIEVVFFGNKAHPEKLVKIFFLKCQYLKEKIKSNNNLGVLFDEKMQWKYQIKYIILNVTRSRNGVKNHTFPASKIFHERITSTIMNF